MSFKFHQSISVEEMSSTLQPFTPIPKVIVAEPVKKIIVLCSKTVDTLKEEVQQKPKKAMLGKDNPHAVITLPVTRERYNLDPSWFEPNKTVTLTMHVQSHYDINVDDSFCIYLDGKKIQEYKWDAKDGIVKCDVLLPPKALQTFSELLIEGVGTLRCASLLIH
jgi:hypothetical protein